MMHRPPYRFYIGINLFLCTSITFLYRTCFNLALNDMVVDPNSNRSTEGLSQEVTRYNWTQSQLMYLQSSYYIGYIITNVVGGILAERFGATRIVTVITAISGLSFSCIPAVASLGFWPLFALRVLQGGIEGPIYPVLQNIIAFWAPPSEKGRFICIFAGSSFGSMLGQGIVAVTITTVGWSYSYYCGSLVGGLIWLYWVWMVRDRPELHNRMTEKEKAYIESAIGSSVDKDVKRIPLRKILSSGPVWALVVLNLGASFANYFQMSSFPTYYNKVLGFSVQEVAHIFTVSSAIRLFTGLGFSYLGDLLLNKDYMRVTTQRKFFCLFSHFLPGAILLSMCFITGHSWLSAGLDVLSTAIKGANNLTVNQNSQDLSPNFASSIYGILNLIGSIGGLSSFYCMTFFMAVNNSDVGAWIYIFILSAVMLFLSNVVFLIWGTGKTQSWNEPDIITAREEVEKSGQMKSSELSKY